MVDIISRLNPSRRCIASNRTRRCVASILHVGRDHRIADIIHPAITARSVTDVSTSFFSSRDDRSSVKTAARADMKQFAEKVSKASVSLGVAGAVLAQVRFRFRPTPTRRPVARSRVSFRTTCRFLFFRYLLDFCRVVNGENTTHSGRESPSGFVCYPRIGWFFPVLHRRNVIHNNIWGNSVMEWMMSPELAAPLRDWGARAR